jgi:hypothetical protein
VEPRTSALSFVPAALMGLVMLVAATAASFAPSEAVGAPVAAIFPPWWDAPQVMAGVAVADAEILREGATPFVLVVSDDAPDLSDRLRAAGAWFVLDPVAAAACLGLDV